MTETRTQCTALTVLRPATSMVELKPAHKCAGTVRCTRVLKQREELIHRHFQAGDGYSDDTKHYQDQADER